MPALRGDFQPRHRRPGRTRHYAGDRGSVRSIAAIFMSPAVAVTGNKMRPSKLSAERAGPGCLGIRFAQDRKAMDTTTLLIIVIIVLLLGGGGFYGRGRWW